MRFLGWFILIGEIVGSISGRWNDHTISSAIMNSALIVAGASLIIVDRFKPNKKVDK